MCRLSTRPALANISPCASSRLAGAILSSDSRKKAQDSGVTCARRFLLHPVRHAGKKNLRELGDEVFGSFSRVFGKEFVLFSPNQQGRYLDHRETLTQLPS
jgi:hypothetical protein